MELIKLDKNFTICQIKNTDVVDLEREFVFITKTDNGISLVCESCYVPINAIIAESNLQALKIEGKDRSKYIAQISNTLSQVKFFLISTYSSIYIFIKSEDFDNSITLFNEKGYILK